MTGTYLPHGWPDGLPDPDLDDLDAGDWWLECARRRLCMQRCSACGTVRFPPRPLCHRCLGPSWWWQEVGPGGEIFSVCEPHYPAHPSLRDRPPYLVVLVTPDGSGGERLVGNLVNGPGDPNDPADQVDLLGLIGRRVNCQWEPVADRYTLPQWRLA